MRVIVTRVQPQAARWAQSLASRFDAVALPLLEICPLADTTALQAARDSWANYTAVKFVSIPAVEFFFRITSGFCFDQSRARGYWYESMGARFGHP